jgi:Spy/CpxP family protein refolding chaperone
MPNLPSLSRCFKIAMLAMKFRSYLVTGLVATALLAHAPAHAQVGRRPGQGGGRVTQLDNAKIAFITSRVSLTQDQAQRFWPLYNEFTGKRRELNRATRLLRRDAANPALSDAQLRDNFRQEFALRQDQLNLDKEYFDKLQKVLTLRQVTQLFEAERDFTKEVLKRVAGPPAASPANE